MPAIAVGAATAVGGFLEFGLGLGYAVGAVGYLATYGAVIVSASMAVSHVGETLCK